MNNIGHISLFIADIVNAFGALKLHEIEMVTQHFFDKDVPQSTIKRCLFVINKLNLIKIDGSNPRHKFYVTTNQKIFINYAYQSDVPRENKDRNSFAYKTISWFHENDASRSIVIKKALGGGHE